MSRYFIFQRYYKTGIFNDTLVIACCMSLDWGCVENFPWRLNVWCDDQYNGGGPTNAEVRPRVYCQAVWDLWEAIYAGKSAPFSSLALLQLTLCSVNDFSWCWLKWNFTTSFSKIYIINTRVIYDKSFDYLIKYFMLDIYFLVSKGQHT